MKLFPATFPSPAENLAADEALLDLCEETGAEFLRFWESPTVFVVVGYGNMIQTEVNVAACQAGTVPILRRCSGGGTVLQGPGCLNYALTLQVPESGPLTTVTGTNQVIMERNRAALESLLQVPVSVQGCTDLACTVENRLRKFSGNAQRRRQHSLLFHGTILYRFELNLVPLYLGPPSRQPEYRAHRNHADFITNIAVAPSQIASALASAWSATTPLEESPDLSRAVSKLMDEKYGRRQWHWRE